MSSTGAPLPARRAAHPLRVGVIGAGRVGAVLAAALRSAGHDVVAAAGESDASRARAAALLPGVRLAKPSQVARASELLLLTVPDDMLENVTAMLAASGALRPGQIVAHTSGAHGLDVLAPAAALGARVLALHPAMTFSGTAADLPLIVGCAYGVTADPAERDLAERLIADLDGRAVWVGEDHRALYHAALAHGANHLVTLVAEAREILGAAVENQTHAEPHAETRSAVAAGPDALEAILRPLLSAALDQALRNGDGALTGPVVRGDVGTVARHVEEIAAHAPQAAASYDALARATVGRVTTDGRLLPIRARRMLLALEGPDSRADSHADSSDASGEAR